MAYVQMPNFQDIKRRMDEQGYNRTYTEYKKWKGLRGISRPFYNWAVLSATPVVWITEIDSGKLNAGITETTLSGSEELNHTGCPAQQMTCISGQSDIRYSKEGIFPSWFGYPMREKAPYKENVDKWFVKISHSQTILSNMLVSNQGQKIFSIWP